VLEVGNKGAEVGRQSLAGSGTVPDDLPVMDLDAVHAVAEVQFGAVSRAQLRAVGCATSWIDRQRDRGMLRRAHPGVYTMIGLRQHHCTDLAAVLLYCGAANGDGDGWMSVDGGVAAGGRTALALLGVSTVQWPDVPEIVTAFPRRKRALGSSARVVCRSGIMPGDIVLHRRLPVTSPERTIIDAADVLYGSGLEDALDAMLRSGVTTLGRIEERMARCEPRGRTGFGRLADFVAERDPATAPTESHLEDAFMRIVRSLPGGPEKWRRQAPFRGDDGSVIRVDFICDDHRLVVETDGWRWHGSRRRFERDAERRRALTLAGYRVMVFTWSDVVSDPAKVRRQLSEAMRV
jgi:very-short-patch-repair endonuclease